MSVSDVLAVAAAVIVAIFVGALAMSLVALGRTLRALRATVQTLRDQALPVVAELRDAARAAADEVERVDRLVSSAEQLEGAVDAAGRFAYRTFANPVVKAMAVGTGVSRAAQRLRVGEAPPDVKPDAKADTRRRRNRRAS
ncbi:MAG: hypothetical protein JWL83_424 [Actinomycetia bacterium]|nr:hypothetical protein [Actinomycetes bacterium]